MFFDLNKKITFRNFLIENDNNKVTYHIEEKGFSPAFDIIFSSGGEEIYKIGIVLNENRVWEVDVARKLPNADIGESEYQQIFKIFENILKEKNVKTLVFVGRYLKDYENFVKYVNGFKNYKIIQHNKYTILTNDEKTIKAFEKKSDSQQALMVAEKILKDCRPFLEEIDYDVEHYKLYRGMGIANKLFYRKKVRLTDRRPVNTDVDIHNKFNELFKEKFGHPFRNGLFVSGNLSNVYTYSDEQIVGNVHVSHVYSVFPIGQFEFIWSDEIFDLFSVISSSREINYEQMVETYKNTDLKAAIKSNNEIMIWVPEYYAVMSGTPFEQQVIEYIKNH